MKKSKFQNGEIKRSFRQAQRPDRLTSGIAHVWQANLEIDKATENHYYSLLSHDEQGRAGRFRFEKDRKHFIAARGMLRLLLGQYLAKKPADLVFQYAEKGKPFIPNPIDLQFNISHANGIALFGFVLKHPIGIDVEWINPKVEIEQVSQHFFAENERKRLMALPEVERLPAFFNCWTRKEAFIKATGDGLSFPLNKFEVSLTADEPATLLATHWDAKERDKWSLFDVAMGEGYKGALAVRRKVLVVNKTLEKSFP